MIAFVDCGILLSKCEIVAAGSHTNEAVLTLDKRLNESPWLYYFVAINLSYTGSVLHKSEQAAISGAQSHTVRK